MPARQRPLYIEMIGPSGVGKTTVMKLIARELGERPLYFGGGLKKRLLHNIVNSMRNKNRVRRLVVLYFYLRRRRGSGRWGALRRAAAVTGMAASTAFIRAGNGALLIEEGPVGYLTSCGGVGEEWKDWASVLLPDHPAPAAFYVMLTAHPTELQRRCELRDRPQKKRLSPTGKEGVSAELRVVGRRYWMNALALGGGGCIEVRTDNKAPAEIASEIYKFIHERLCTELKSGRRGPLATPSSKEVASHS